MKKIFKNENGGGMVMVLVLSAVVAGFGTVLMKSSLIRSKITTKEKQDIVIKEAIQDINTQLSDINVCKQMMDDGYDSIGTYSSGTKPSAPIDIEIDNISLAADNGRVKDVAVVFSKPNTNGSRKTIKKIVKVQTFSNYDSAGVAQTYCTNYETSAADDTYQYFCALYGGSFSAATGACEFNQINDGNFKDILLELACESLGASINGSKCGPILIPGYIYSNHFNSNEVSFVSSNTKNTDYVSSACTGIQVAVGVNENGALDCRDLQCPKLQTSDYLPVVVGSDLKCQCQRNSTLEKPALACGQVDTSSCDNYTVNDGCGLGKTCTIIGGKTTGCSVATTEPPVTPPTCTGSAPASNCSCDSGSWVCPPSGGSGSGGGSPPGACGGCTYISGSGWRCTHCP